MYNLTVLEALSALATEFDNFNSTYVIPRTKKLFIKLKNDDNIYQIDNITNTYLYGLTFKTFELKNRIYENDVEECCLNIIISYLLEEFNKERYFRIMKSDERKEFWFETQDGIKIDLPRKYTNRIDLENHSYYFADSKSGREFPTLNELTRNKVLKICYDYKIVDLRYKCYPKKISIERIQKFFKEQGYNVTEEAIKHNFSAYSYGMKSGYRDEENDYHLFTPCNLNPLTFSLTTLSKFTNWQTTYKC